MSKKKITQQQAKRIHTMQANYHANASTPEQFHLEEGLVITRFGKTLEIEDASEKRILCSIRSHLPVLVAGDNVIWERSNDTQGVVIAYHPRTSVLERTGKDNRVKPIAANITQLLIVLAPLPEPAWPLLDSYLVLAEQLQLQVCIILNKIDLPCEQLKRELLSVYTGLDYSVLFVSKQLPETIQALKEKLNNHLNIFVGQSGVGKSSLIATILPHETIPTGELSAISLLGCHTTSNSRLYHFQSGGSLIDSPGIRELNLSHLSTPVIIRGYKEFIPFIHLCKFRNCNHRNSPGCALLQALQQGKIAKRRYDNFLKLTC